MLVIGANPAVSNGSITTMPDARGRLKAVQARGGRVVVVDPRRTETARLASEHVAIRPGGDPFLLLAMLHVIFAEGLDRAPRGWTGLDEVRELRRAAPPESAAPGCGVDAETIIAAGARVRRRPLGGRLRPDRRVPPRHGQRHALADQRAQRRDRQPRPARRRDVPLTAGRPRSVAAHALGTVEYDEYRSRGAGLPELVGELSLTAMPDEITRPGPRQLRGLIVVAGNPTVSGPDATQIRRRTRRARATRLPRLLHQRDRPPRRLRAAAGEPSRAQRAGPRLSCVQRAQQRALLAESVRAPGGRAGGLGHPAGARG